jgi:hypothetical protein
MTLTVVSGVIHSLQIREEFIDVRLFFRNQAEVDKDKRRQKVLAIAAAAVGQGAAAASSLQNPEVSAITVEFEVNEKTFVGLFSMSRDEFPFHQGDEIKVVVQDEIDAMPAHAVAIARPIDRIVVMPPYSNRGRGAYLRRSVKRLLAISFFAGMGFAWVSWTGKGISIHQSLYVLESMLAVSALYAFIEWRIYLENLKPLVHLAEDIFSALGLDNVRAIDLIRHSKNTRTGAEPPGYRWHYFRY